jgi:hypothetical protein
MEQHQCAHVLLCLSTLQHSRSMGLGCMLRVRRARLLLRAAAVLLTWSPV